VARWQQDPAVATTAAGCGSGSGLDFFLFLIPLNSDGLTPSPSLVTRLFPKPAVTASFGAFVIWCSEVVLGSWHPSITSLDA
jgi:hypothetical protein